MTEDIPPYLIIPAATRALAWIKAPPTPWPTFANPATREEEPATKALRAHMEREQERKKQEGLASLRAYKEANPAPSKPKRPRARKMKARS